MRVNKRAFTLIELLIVVAIITVLIAILIPSLAAAKRVSMQTKCGAQLKGLGSAIGLFNGDFNRLPVAGRGVNLTSTSAAEQATTSDGIRSVFWNLLYPPAAKLSKVDPEQTDTGMAYDGLWTGLPNALANYAGTNKSKLFVCPSTNSTSAFSVFWDLDVSNGTLGTGNPPPRWLTNYAFFMGDPGNTFPGYTSFYQQVTITGATYTANGSNYNALNVPLNNAAIIPSMVLAQDLQYRDTAGKFYGNHPTNGGTLTADSYPSNGLGTDKTGFYSSNLSTDMAGSNVLYADYHADFIKTANLTVVAASTDKFLFVGSQNNK
jgi:prepilin-type N-terminal cleavage/methylation domain-containing protein